ncbi:hypothetical protein EVAR_36547_1 [Eumeta japonica]|uniref:Endonuclease/exonuclease/phosphatase domain-containing protein n=1 Tax=Eumeta variegata TaxID=151549 RepID=A0A4C1ZAF3_EUMVA|nr:hypothetical protein EVAR_36547_1 [Eumeta japonica]
MSSLPSGTREDSGETKIRVLQLNFNHYEAAHGLLMQTVRELHPDVALISELYRNLASQPWEMDHTAKAAIWFCCKLPFQSIVNNTETGSVVGKVGSIHLYSCYAPSSVSLTNLMDFLPLLIKDAKQHFPVFIAGDFNS